MFVSLTPSFSGLQFGTKIGVKKASAKKSGKPTSRNTSGTAVAKTTQPPSVGRLTRQLQQLEGQQHRMLLTRYGLPTSTSREEAVTRHNTQWTGREEERATVAEWLQAKPNTPWAKLLPLVERQLAKEEAERRGLSAQTEGAKTRFVSAHGNRRQALWKANRALENFWVVRDAADQLLNAKALAEEASKARGKRKETLTAAQQLAEKAADAAVMTAAEHLAKQEADFNTRGAKLIAAAEAKLCKDPVKARCKYEARLKAATAETAKQRRLYRKAKAADAEATAASTGRLTNIVSPDVKALLKAHQLAKQLGIEGPAVASTKEATEKETARLQAILDVNKLGKELKLKGWKPLTADRFGTENDKPAYEEKRLHTLAEQHALAKTHRKEGLKPLPINTPTLAAMAEVQRVEDILQARELATKLAERVAVVNGLAGDSISHRPSITIPMTLSAENVRRILDQLNAQLR